MNEARERGTRRRRSREEAERLVEEFEQSGLTRRAFCRERGLSVGTLDNYRKRRSSREAVSPDAALSSPGRRSAMTFVPLELVDHATTAQPGVAQCDASKSATLFVELSHGRRIGVAAGFDAATLTRLIAVLEQA